MTRSQMATKAWLLLSHAAFACWKSATEQSVNRFKVNKKGPETMPVMFMSKLLALTRLCTL